MKQYLIALTTVCALFLSGCATTQVAITNDVKNIATTGMHFVPKSLQATVAAYVDGGAAALRTVNVASTAAEVKAIVLTWIPANIQTAYPAIVTILTDAITTAFAQYGVAGLGYAADGLNQAMAPYIIQVPPHPAP